MTGMQEPEGPEGSLVWETEGDIVAVTEMGNSEKWQLEKVIPSVGMCRCAVTSGHLGSRLQSEIGRGLDEDRGVEVVSTGAGPVAFGVNGFSCSFIH